MTSQENPESAKLSLKPVPYDWYILTGLMLVSILGVGIIDGSEQTGHWYWLAMVPVFFCACLFLEWRSARQSGIPARTVIIQQVLHWSGLLVAVILVFFLRNIGSLDNQTTGLILLLLFAMATFHAGMSMGWLFRLLGIFLAASVYLVAYIEHYILIVAFLSAMVFVTYYFIRRHMKP